jgi:hypothetical protein
VGPGESGQLLTRTVEMQLQVAKGIRINGRCIELETGGSNQWICGQAIAQLRQFAAAEDKSRSKAPLTANAKYNIPNYFLSPKTSNSEFSSFQMRHLRCVFQCLKIYVI